MNRIVVSQDGSGNFQEIQDAIDSVRVLPLEPITIFIKNGVYKEKVTIPDNKSNLFLLGENKENTIISFNEHAQMLDSSGHELGTFRTPVFSALANDFQMKNITIENSAGYGSEIGQALALYVSGDRCYFKDVQLRGNQDTLYSCKGRHYFYQCFIEGHVDFIFGSATVVFDHCTIHSLRNGYITAASTPKETTYGFVFLDCKLTGSAAKHSVYLGRPWRPDAQTFFIRTWMGEHIHPNGWDNWRNIENEKTARYGEFENYGPGALLKQRVNWAPQIPQSEAKKLTPQYILNQHNDWIV